MSLRWRLIRLGFVGLLLTSGSAIGALTPQNVLVVVNTNSADSVTIGSFYTNLHPGASIVNVGTTTGNIITRSNFFTEIRDPIRTYLNSTAGLATQIVSIVTTRGVPYQLHGINSENLLSGTADYASVDSELTVLWQDMVSGATFSNAYPANTTVLNPYYFDSPYSPISAFSRSNIQTLKNWSGVVISNGFLVYESPSYSFNGANAFGFATKSSEPAANQLTPGDLYLVTRLSGYSVTDVTNSLARSQNIQINKSSDVIVLNKGAQNFDAGIYTNAQSILTNAGFGVLLTPSGPLVSNLPPGQRLLSYSTYGTYLSPGSGAYYIFSNTFTYAPGAIFNSYESFNGTEFTSPANPRSQGQVADWFSVGGTLGFGHVNEPFTFAVANEDVYLPNLLINGFSWAEAAYASLPVISWQNLVLGDPLATFSIVPEPSALLGWVGVGFLVTFLGRQRS
jgi:uncharacterized protein (TIGR03790 family)